MKTKSERREFIRWNQSKMDVSGMYVKKVLLPLAQKRGLLKK